MNTFEIEFKGGKAHYLIAAARICRQIAQTPGSAQPDRKFLGLITQKADHSRLLERFEALHGQLQVLFNPEKRNH